jgi:hypothetical protein
VLVGELAVQDADFRTWWAAHQVAGTYYGTKHYRHPVVGDLTLDCGVSEQASRPRSLHPA